ncbi:hypothetical protein ACQEVC_20555 [Plantactinospora sp. CA-294935]|uniref:hypothetical protein n=1 Tax=Plantactinospora sp. CA-294935 TaxID=3240012 RepID=UPI003D8DE8F2
MATPTSYADAGNIPVSEPTQAGRPDASCKGFAGYAAGQGRTASVSGRIANAAGRRPGPTRAGVARQDTA